MIDAYTMGKAKEVVDNATKSSAKALEKDDSGIHEAQNLTEKEKTSKKDQKGDQCRSEEGSREDQKGNERRTKEGQDRGEAGAKEGRKRGEAGAELEQGWISSIDDQGKIQGGPRRDQGTIKRGVIMMSSKFHIARIGAESQGPMRPGGNPFPL